MIGSKKSAWGYLMTYRLGFLAILTSLFFVNCTGQKAPIHTHESAKDSQAGIGLNGVSPISIAAEINLIADETKRLARAEQFLANEFVSSDLKIKYSSETQKLISFALKKWSFKGDAGAFTNLVNSLFNSLDWDDRLIDAFEIVETKSLIRKSAEASKDPVFKFKLMMLFKKIQQVGLSAEDQVFMQNQLAQIRKETDFKFTNSSEAWIKTNRALIEIIMSSANDSDDKFGQAKFDKNEFEGSAITRSQRAKLLASFIAGKKSLDQILSSESKREQTQYKERFNKIKTDLPIFQSRIKLNKIENETTLNLIVSLVTKDLDANLLETLFKQSLLDKQSIREGIWSWIDYEVSLVVQKYKEEFQNFKSRKENVSYKDYFPEMKRALSSSQVLSRQRAEQLRLFLPVAKVLGDEKLHQRIEDLDTFFKRFLNANTSLVILDLFRQAGGQLKDEIRVNSQLIKKDSALDEKVSIALPSIRSAGENYYLGELPDQFDFSADNRMMQKFETIDGLDLGIHLGLFKELGLDETTLVKSLFAWISQNRLSEPDPSSMRAGQLHETRVFKLHEALKLKLGSGQWNSFKMYCEALKSNQTIARDFNFDDIKASLVMGVLSENIESRTTSLESGSSGGRLGLYVYTNEIAKSVEILRIDVSYTVLYFETLRDSLKRSGIDVSGLDSDLDHYKSFFKDYLKDLLDMLYVFDDCYFLKHKKERELIAKLFEYENKYWKHILPKLRGKGKALISTALPLSYKLPNGVKERSYFNESSVQIIPLEFYFRVKQYMQYGLAIGSEQLPPIDAKLNLVVNPSLATQKFFKNATFVEATISSDLSESDLQNILTSHGFTDFDFIQWFNQSKYAPSKFMDSLDTLNSLYRFGTSLKSSFGIDNGITLERLSKTYFNILSLYNISDSMTTVFGFLNFKEYTNLKDLFRSGFILKTEDDVIPFLDDLMIAVSADYVGYFGKDSNFENSHGKVIRPPQLFGNRAILTMLYRYSDEKYVSPFRNYKMNFSRYVDRVTQDIEVGRRVLDYVDYVAKTRNGQGYPIQIRTDRVIDIPLFSNVKKENLLGSVLSTTRNLKVIQDVNLRYQSPVESKPAAGQ